MAKTLGMRYIAKQNCFEKQLIKLKLGNFQPKLLSTIALDTTLKEEKCA